ncbi:hypothetical protein ACKWTF_001988 [Chironomus riparius]
MRRPKIFVEISSLVLTMYVVISLFKICSAGPNPITDNESDDSLEHSNYYYSFTDEPYWKAFSPFLRKKLKRHDSLERMMLRIRDLDFKLREAWTPKDKPFTQH